MKLETFEPGSAPPVQPHAHRRGGLRRLAVALALAALAIGFADVHTASADTFQTCGRSGVANGNGVACMTLPAAIAAAQASFGPDTIELFPGTYCPVSITDETGGITIRGIGLAGIQTGNGPTGLSGSEAELATFSWADTCAGSAPNALIAISNPGSHTGSITLENLAVDGSGGGSQIGIDINDIGATLRDVLAEHNSLFGIDYFGDDFEMDNSAAIGNAIGIEFVGEGSAVDSTFADNTNTGVELSSYDFHLINDTVSGNLWGVDAPGSGNHLQVVDTIVAGNGTTGGAVPLGGDCRSTVDWENSFSSHVLKGPSCTTGSGDDGSDIAFNTATTIAAPALNGGPTPSILPPSQAVGHGQSCAFNVDQREFVRSGTCTIGSVDPSANGTPNPVATQNPLDFGQVDAGVTASRSETVSNAGGDYVGVSSVSATGGFTIGFDGCTYASLAPFGCSISVSLPTPAVGHYTGTLTIDTTGGDISVPLSADAVVRPVGDPDSYDVAFGQQLVVSAPGVLANDAAGTTVFDVVDQPGNGTLVGPASDGSFSYTPDNGFSGLDSFTYRIVDGMGAQSDPITVDLNVAGPVFYVNSSWAGTAPGADPDGAGPATSFGTDAFATITDALDAAGDSTVIHVESGTYNERSPDIRNAGVQLLGNGAASTHLTVGSSLVVEGGSDLVSWLDIHGTVASGSPAVRFDDRGSTLQGSTVSDAETGVFVNGSGGGEDEGEDAAPAALLDLPPGATISNDDIHGVAIGIEFSGVAGGVIEGNDIHDLTGSTDDYLAAVLLEDDNDNQPSTGSLVDDNTIGAGAETGIDVETSDNAIDGNMITGDEVGIYLSDDSEDDVDSNQITNNTISSSGEEGIQLESGVDGVDIDGNTISGTQDAGSSGIIADRYGAAILLNTFGPTRVTIEHNHLTDNTGWGILQESSGGASTGNSADHNDITGNGIDGVENDDTASFDARNNWWGSASGPSGQGPGTGDGVSKVVLFDPWLLCPFEDGSCATNQPPTAAFMVTPSVNPSTPLLVSVDGTASHDPDGTIASYAWDFGDSTTGSGATTTHTYATGGTYTITLTATDNQGASDHVSHTVTVPVSFALTVSTTGTGTVKSNTGGIVCPGPCSASYTAGTVVTLTETPGAGQQFSGWSGACSGTGSCSVTMNAAMSVGATFSAVSVPPPPTPSASIGDVTHPEGSTGDTPFAFTVTLSGASDSPVTIAYATADGTASSQSDYAAASGTLTFTPGQTSATVTVLVHGDTTPENDETFTVNLGSPVDATIADGQGLGTIQNDDLPALSVSDVSHLEGNAGNTRFTFTISLSAAAPFAVSVEYRTKDGTAKAPSDYAAVNGIATFAPGQTTRTVTVLVHGDRTLEADETFSFGLSGPLHATIARAVGTGTIRNDDPAADLSVTKSVSPAQPYAGETTTYTITVSNHGPQAAAAPVVVDALPAGVIFVSASSGCSAKGAPVTVTCRLKPLEARGSAKLQLVVTPNSIGEATNTVTVSSPTADPVPANNTFKLSAKVVDLGINNPSGPPSCAVRGTAWADTITTAARAVHICAGGGDDTIDVSGGTGGDVVDAGSGNDVIYASNGKVDTIDGGPGYDTCVCDPSDHVTNVERRVGQ